MKRITVKDKILLHIQQYKDYSHQYELPPALTQDGIAEAVGISRSHVAITITELKRKEMVIEQLKYIKGLKRQRKVYFFTNKGKEFTNDLRNRFYRSSVMFRDIEGNITEITLPELLSYLYPFTHKYINIYDVLKHLDKDNIFDSNSFIAKVKTEEPAKTKLEHPAKAPTAAEEAEPKSKPTLPTLAKTVPAPQEYTPQPSSSRPLAPSAGDGQLEVQMLEEARARAQPQPPHIPSGHSKNNPSYYPVNPYYYPYYNPYYNPYKHFQQYPTTGQNQHSNPYQYYYPNYDYYFYHPYRTWPLTHEEKKGNILSTLYFFFGFGVCASLAALLLLFISDGYCLLAFLPPLIISFSFGIVGFSYGLIRIPFIGIKGRRLLLAMAIFYIGMLIVTMELLLFNFVRYIDASQVGPILLGMLVFLGVVSLGKPIKTSHRIELAFTVGIFCILFGIFSSLLLPGNYITNPFLFSPFWILFGITSIIVGNELMGGLERDTKLNSIIKNSTLGTGAFLFLLTATRLATGEHLGDSVHLSYLFHLCWLCVGVVLISVRLVREPTAGLMMESVKISLPIGLGVFFIFFGVFLFNLDKHIEGIIEIIIGAVVLRYAFSKKLYSENKSEMILKFVFPSFVILSEFFTFYLLAFS